MKNRYILLMITAFSFLFVNLNAQGKDDNDYSNNRGVKSKVNQEAINSNKGTPVKIIESIVGKWQVDRVLKGDKDITNSDTLVLNRAIEFNRENQYTIMSGNEETEHGSFRVNENQSSLYLERENSQEATEWKVSFNNNGTMTLQQTGTHPHADSFKYVYVKTSTASRKTEQQN
jgi:hypothetical protein